MGTLAPLREATLTISAVGGSASPSDGLTAEDRYWFFATTSPSSGIAISRMLLTVEPLLVEPHRIDNCPLFGTSATALTTATVCWMPRPETNLLICHGLPAPRARWRERVVAYGRVEPEPTASAPPLAPGPEGPGGKRRPRACSWAALMHRAFAIDVLACAHCGGRLRLIATLHDPAVIRKLLAHLGMAPAGPSPGPAPPAP